MFGLLLEPSSLNLALASLVLVWLGISCKTILSTFSQDLEPETLGIHWLAMVSRKQNVRTDILKFIRLYAISPKSVCSCLKFVEYDLHMDNPGWETGPVVAVVS